MEDEEEREEGEERIEREGRAWKMRGRKGLLARYNHKPSNKRSKFTTRRLTRMEWG